MCAKGGGYEDGKAVIKGARVEGKAGEKDIDVT